MGVYEIRVKFRAPLPFVFSWCTDYSAEDSRLEGEPYIRRILRRTARRVIFEDLYDRPFGWMWSHTKVDLRPPDRWHAEAVGSHRGWSIDYTLSSRDDATTELLFRGKRRPTALAGRNPPKAKLERDLRRMWRNFGRALERDYRATLARERKQ